MRYSADHKAETRKRLLKATGALAKKKGFAATGVDAFMDAAGVTSGAFYVHFGSKTELFSELLRSELDHSFRMFVGNPSDESEEEWARRQINLYLDWRHVQHPDKGCAVPTLGAEVGRADKDAKKIFEDAAKRIHVVWQEKLGDEKLPWAVAAQMIGAILLARAMASEKTAKKVLDSSKEFLTEALAKRNSA
jgi:AcrR family transcriptional regulator